ncbi:unnamed protein product [Pseudo-nitzschia multistriata]|uniref:Uncharacterized protein n=1 Tax=Pseudo-nitzschia multistriata TaxID=183589 RepID=A0A448ZJI7_9STRA|nr:unnamed protein product [Pseudo-nitzschia multistriata]
MNKLSHNETRRNANRNCSNECVSEASLTIVVNSDDDIEYNSELSESLRKHRDMIREMKTKYRLSPSFAQQHMGASYIHRYDNSSCANNVSEQPRSRKVKIWSALHGSPDKCHHAIPPLDKRSTMRAVYESKGMTETTQREVFWREEDFVRKVNRVNDDDFSRLVRNDEGAGRPQGQTQRIDSSTLSCSHVEIDETLCESDASIDNFFDSFEVSREDEEIFPEFFDSVSYAQSTEHLEEESPSSRKSPSVFIRNDVQDLCESQAWNESYKRHSAEQRAIEVVDESEHELILQQYSVKENTFGNGSSLIDNITQSEESALHEVSSRAILGSNNEVIVAESPPSVKSYEQFVDEQGRNSIKFIPATKNHCRDEDEKDICNSSKAQLLEYNVTMARHFEKHSNFIENSRKKEYIEHAVGSLENEVANIEETLMQTIGNPTIANKKKQNQSLDCDDCPPNLHHVRHLDEEFVRNCKFSSSTFEADCKALINTRSANRGFKKADIDKKGSEFSLERFQNHSEIELGPNYTMSDTEQKAIGNLMAGELSSDNTNLDTNSIKVDVHMEHIVPPALNIEVSEVDNEDTSLVRDDKHKIDVWFEKHTDFMNAMESNDKMSATKSIGSNNTIYQKEPNLESKDEGRHGSKKEVLTISNETKIEGRIAILNIQSEKERTTEEMEQFRTETEIDTIELLSPIQSEKEMISENYEQTGTKAEIYSSFKKEEENISGITEQTVIEEISEKTEIRAEIPRSPLQSEKKMIDEMLGKFLKTMESMDDDKFTDDDAQVLNSSRTGYIDSSSVLDDSEPRNHYSSSPDNTSLKSSPRFGYDESGFSSPARSLLEQSNFYKPSKSEIASQSNYWSNLSEADSNGEASLLKTKSISIMPSFRPLDESRSRIASPDLNLSFVRSSENDFLAATWIDSSGSHGALSRILSKDEPGIRTASKEDCSMQDNSLCIMDNAKGTNYVTDTPRPLNPIAAVLSRGFSKDVVAQVENNGQDMSREGNKKSIKVIDATDSSKARNPFAAVSYQAFSGNTVTQVDDNGQDLLSKVIDVLAEAMNKSEKMIDITESSRPYNLNAVVLQGTSEDEIASPENIGQGKLCGAHDKIETMVDALGSSTPQKSFPNVISRKGSHIKVAQVENGNREILIQVIDKEKTTICAPGFSRLYDHIPDMVSQDSVKNEIIQVEDSGQYVPLEATDEVERSVAASGSSRVHGTIPNVVGRESSEHDVALVEYDSRQDNPFEERSNGLPSVVESNLLQQAVNCQSATKDVVATEFDVISTLCTPKFDQESVSEMSFSLVSERAKDCKRLMAPAVASQLDLSSCGSDPDHIFAKKSEPEDQNKGCSVETPPTMEKDELKSLVRLVASRDKPPGTTQRERPIYSLPKKMPFHRTQERWRKGSPAEKFRKRIRTPSTPNRVETSRSPFFGRDKEGRLVPTDGSVVGWFISPGRYSSIGSPCRRTRCTSQSNAIITGSVPFEKISLSKGSHRSRMRNENDSYSSSSLIGSASPKRSTSANIQTLLHSVAGRSRSPAVSLFSRMPHGSQSAIRKLQRNHCDINGKLSGKTLRVCNNKFVYNLHPNCGPCDRCWALASPEEREKFEIRGSHLRIAKTRSGCDRTCTVFPSDINDGDSEPVRLCRQCFFATHKCEDCMLQVYRGNNSKVIRSN